MNGLCNVKHMEMVLIKVPEWSILFSVYSNLPKSRGRLDLALFTLSTPNRQKKNQVCWSTLAYSAFEGGVDRTVI